MTLAGNEGRRVSTGRLACDVGAGAGERTVEKGETAAVAVGERGKWVGGAVAGGSPGRK